jgi:hypothetical protein
MLGRVIEVSCLCRGRDGGRIPLGSGVGKVRGRNVYKHPYESVPGISHMDQGEWIQYCRIRLVVFWIFLHPFASGSFNRFTSLPSVENSLFSCDP